MHNNQSSYSRWTWIVAIILALILLWMLLTGRGPSAACCGVTAPAPVEAVTPVAEPVAEPVAAEAFGFSANCNEFTHTGSATAWVANANQLKSTLCADSSIKAEGDDKRVVLTGEVADEATRVKTGEDAQSFLGPDYTVDNQITVKAAEPAPVATEAPPAAKLYFATAKTSQPADSPETLAPIIAWLNAHPESKAVISGFHDPRGSKARNEQLAKGRAQSTYDALVAAGIDASRIEMRKPAETEGDGDLNEARRVEVSVE